MNETPIFYGQQPHSKTQTNLPQKKYLPDKKLWRSEKNIINVELPSTEKHNFSAQSQMRNMTVNERAERRHEHDVYLIVAYYSEFA